MCLGLVDAAMHYAIFFNLPSAFPFPFAILLTTNRVLILRPYGGCQVLDIGFSFEFLAICFYFVVNAVSH